MQTMYWSFLMSYFRTQSLFQRLWALWQEGQEAFWVHNSVPALSSLAHLFKSCIYRWSRDSVRTDISMIRNMSVSTIPSHCYWVPMMIISPKKDAGGSTMNQLLIWWYESMTHLVIWETKESQSHAVQMKWTKSIWLKLKHPLSVHLDLVIINKS